MSFLFTAAKTVNEKAKDEKTEIVPKLLTVNPESLKTMMRQSVKRGKSAGKIAKFNLVISQTSTSGAAAAQAPRFDCIPGACTEFANISALYDEFKVDAITAHVKGYVSTVGQTAGVDMAVAYDPTNTGAYGSVVGVMEAEQHLGPLALAGEIGATGISGAPSAFTRTGFWVWKIKLPKGPLVHDPNVLSVSGTGDWTSTTVTTTSYGALKFYVEAAQAGTTSVVAKMIYHCSFRIRS